VSTRRTYLIKTRARAEARRGEKGEVGRGERERERWPRREEERWGMGIGRWRRGGGPGGCDGGGRSIRAVRRLQIGTRKRVGPGPIPARGPAGFAASISVFSVFSWCSKFFSQFSTVY
jgi:hypothetical protein